MRACSEPVSAPTCSCSRRAGSRRPRTWAPGYQTPPCSPSGWVPRVQQCPRGSLGCCSAATEMGVCPLRKAHCRPQRYPSDFHPRTTPEFLPTKYLRGYTRIHKAMSLDGYCCLFVLSVARETCGAPRIGQPAIAAHIKRWPSIHFSGQFTSATAKPQDRHNQTFQDAYVCFEWEGDDMQQKWSTNQGFIHVNITTGMTVFKTFLRSCHIKHPRRRGQGGIRFRARDKQRQLAH